MSLAQGGWFEVSKLEFIFYSAKNKVEDIKLVIEGMKKHMKRYASHTSYETSYEVDSVMSSDVKVKIEFSKSISLNTVNKLLSQMALEKIYRIIYMPLDKKVDVSVMG